MHMIGSQPDSTVFPTAPQEHYRLDVYLVDDRAVDVTVDGESVFPTWFKLEFKETGEISAKVKGLKLSSKRGDTIAIHLGRPGETQSS
jgi:hypothetical protein